MSTILACTDGSQYSASVYQHAAWVAKQSGAAIHVLHVIERDEARPAADLSGNLGFDASAELMEELVDLDEAHARVARLRGKAVLEDAVRQLKEESESLEVITTQRHGSLVETLDEFENNADLVIVGKRGEHVEQAKGHLGSNLERVVRSAKIPVMVASRAFQPIENFMIAFDGGASSLKAVHFAATQPLLKGVKAHLLAIGKPGSNLELELGHAATGLRGAGFEVHADLMSGDADELISREAEKLGIDLVMMGAYGHSMIRRFIIGSTTTTLVRTCKVPVLLFR